MLTTRQLCILSIMPMAMSMPPKSSATRLTLLLIKCSSLISSGYSIKSRSECFTRSVTKVVATGATCFIMLRTTA